MTDNTILPAGLMLLHLFAGAAGASDAPPDHPLPFPVYVASPIDGPIAIDGRLEEPAWRSTALGWGLTHALEPNLLCPDPTLFRIGYDAEGLWIALACWKRPIQDDLPPEVWRPRESELIDIQALPRHARMRGVSPPVNTAEVLLGRGGRIVRIIFAPPSPLAAKVEDAVGERGLPLAAAHAYRGGPDDALWTAEARIPWAAMGWDPPASGEDWALNVYRDIRFFSNWAFVGWMRARAKVEASRYDITDRFGRIIFAKAEGEEDPDRTEASALAAAREIAAARGPVRLFLRDALFIVTAEGAPVRQRYAQRARALEAYGRSLLRTRTRLGNDLPYAPFYPQEKPGPHLEVAARRIAGLERALGDPVPWDDPAARTARIAHALPEAREGIFAFRQERLLRGLPE
ncbi:MAG: hypothetical protein JXP34_10670 [Planctomycetes bacterium]|nr:hypothetical protein [Planctomycetota bacterium]